MIILKNMTKQYSDGAEKQNVLKAINLTIKKGDFISIRGASGSGKSTLLNLLGLLDEPSSGTYHLNGIDVSSISFDKMATIRNKSIGMVFQSYNLIEELDVTENIALPFLYSDSNKDDTKINNLISLVELTDKAHYYPDQLSGGQQQRVALARAMIMEPDILLLDEPTGNLDKNMSNNIMKLIVDFHQRGNTICLVTHEPEYADLATTQYEMVDGELRGLN